MISLSLIAAVHAFPSQSAIHSIYSTKRLGLVYVIVNDEVYEMRRNVWLRKVAKLGRDDAFIGTDERGRPLAVVDGFLNLNPPTSAFFDGFRISPDYSRDILGVRQGVVFTGVEGEVRIDFALDPDKPKRVTRYKVLTTGDPSDVAVSPGRRTAAVCLWKEGSATSEPKIFEIVCVDLRTGQSTLSRTLNIGRVLGIAFRDESKVVVLVGNPPLNDLHLPPKPKAFQGQVYELDIPQGRLELRRLLTLTSRRKYLANLDGHSVSILTESGVSEYP